jgi:hypothetical protein
VQRRLDRIIPVLERKAALEPRRVTLKLTDRPLREAVAEVSKQTGYRIKLVPPRKRDRQVYSFDLVGVSFWEAIHAIAEAGQLSFNVGENNRFELTYSDEFSPFDRVNGVFRLSPQNFHYQSSSTLTGVGRKSRTLPPPTESLHFTFGVTTEQKLPLLGLGEAKLASAYDEENRSMLPVVETVDGEQIWIGRMGGWRCAFGGGFRGSSGATYTTTKVVELVRPSRTSQQVKSLKGTVMATLLIDRTPEIVIDQPLGSATKTFHAGNVSFELTEASRRDPRGYQFALHVRGANPNDLTEDPVSTLGLRVELHDADGNKFLMQEGDFECGADGSRNLRCAFMPPESKRMGEPAKLIYFRWTLLQHPVEFEFANLPLP